MINNLPPEFGGAITSLGSIESIPIREIGARISERLWGIKNAQKDLDRDEVVKTEAAMVVKQETRTCYNCGKVGHLAKKCRNPKNSGQHRNEFAKTGNNPQGPSSSSKYKNNTQGNRHEYAMTIDERIAMVTQDQLSNGSEWYVDSAASYHYCHNKSIMYELEKADIQVKVGDGTLVNIEYIGRVDIEVEDQYGNPHILKLSNVRYSDRLASNLLSVRRAVGTCKDLEVAFSSTSASIRDREGKVIHLGQ
ncbi:hypothetical protein V1522DRAFT_395807, partial [Lipomyces starkeyi]